MVPRNLNASTIDTVLYMMVSGRRVGGLLLKLQVVKTAPDSQLFNLLSVGRLVTILNEADECGVI